MSDELGRKLDVVAHTLSKIKFSPSGSNLDELTFEVCRNNHALVFKHGIIEVRVANFELVDAEKWRKEEDYRYPATSGKFGVRYYYYKANVSWKVDEHEGKGKVALGYSQHRDRLLRGLDVRFSRERGLIDDLLWQLDRCLGRLYHTELLAPAKAEERTHPEDRRGRGEWKTSF